MSHQKPKISKPANEKTIKHHKEPKFVPYEPYKAAVTPIVPEKKEKIEKKVVKKDNVARVLPVTLEKTPRIENDVRKELEELKKEKQSLEHQLTIQTKVNTDLKKLLVASVGEDLEARVQFLTEDKIKLAYDVHHYVQRLLDDHEEMEKLSIQCDVWRSKFLASSLIVDELANWKAVLYHRYDEALETLKNLLDEQVKLYENLQNSFSHLKAIQNSLDQSPTLKKPEPNSLASLSAEIEKLSSSLHLFLCDNKSVITGSKKIILSSAQEKAHQIVTGPRLCFHVIDSQSPIKGIVQRFHPNARYEYLTMNCCNHCSGEIKLL